MAIDPKTTREHIGSLYGHVKGVKKDIAHIHNGINKEGDKVAKRTWVLLAPVGTVAVVLSERLITKTARSS